MSAKKKQKSRKSPTRDVPKALSAEKEWSQALDEWDQTLEVPEAPNAESEVPLLKGAKRVGESPKASDDANKPKTASRAAEQTVEHFDEALINGLLDEVDHEATIGGQALGSLLGSEVVEPSSGNDVDDDSPQDEEHVHEEMILEEAEDALASEWSGEGTKTATGTFKEERGPDADLDLDFDALFDGILSDEERSKSKGKGTEKRSGARPSMAANVVVPTEAIASNVPEAIVQQDPDLTPSPEPLPVSPPPLDLFDEILPMAAPDFVSQIQGGDVLSGLLSISAEQAKRTATTDEGLLSRLERRVATEPEPVCDRLPVEDIPVALFELDLDRVTPPTRIEFREPESVDYWKVVQRAAEGAVRDATSTAMAAELEYVSGQAFDMMGERDEAIGKYREALLHKPNFMPALLGLWRHFHERRDPQEMLSTLSVIKDALNEPYKSAASTIQAELLWLYAGDEGGAKRIISGVHPYAPRCRHQFIALDIAFASDDLSSQHTELVSLGDQISDATWSNVFIAELAQSYEFHDQRDKAYEAYRRSAQPNADALIVWEGASRTASTPVQERDAIEARITHAELWGAWSGRRLRHYAIQGHFREALRVDVPTVLSRAMTQDPHDLLIHRAVAASCRRAKSVQPAGEIYERLATLHSETMSKAFALVHAARLYEDEANLSRALERYLEAQTLVETLHVTRLSTMRLQLNSSDILQRATAYRQLADNAHDMALKQGYLFESARVYQDELANDEAASEALLSCLRITPHSLGALWRLEDSCRRSGSLGTLFQARNDVAQALEDDTYRRELYVQLALSTEKSHGAQMLDALDKALEGRPDDGSLRFLRERLLKELANSAELVEELESQVKLVQDAPWATELELRIAHGLHFAGDTAAARTRFQRTLEQHPESWLATWLVTVIVGGESDWNELQRVWRHHASALKSGTPEQSFMWLRLGALAEYALRDPDAALDYYESADRDETIQRYAARARWRLKREAHAISPTETWLLEELERTTERSKRLAIHLALAELCWRQGKNEDDATVHFQNALAETPSEILAQIAFIDFLRERNAWESLKAVIVDDLAKNERHKQDPFYWEVLADIEFRLTQDKKASLVQYRQAAELESYPLYAIHQHAVAQCESSDWAALTRTLLREASRTNDGKDASAIFTDAGFLTIFGIDQGDFNRILPDISGIDTMDSSQTAYRAFANAIERDPRNELALHQLIDGIMNAYSSISTLNPEHRAHLAQYYAMMRAQLGDPRSTEQGCLAIRAGELNSDSYEPYSDAMALIPADLMAAIRWRDGAVTQTQWTSAVTALVNIANASALVMTKVNALNTAAAICEEELKNSSLAQELYARALSLNADDDFSTERLEALYARGQHWNELVQLLLTRLTTANVAAQPNLRCALHRQIAELAAERLDRRDLALEHWQQLLKLRPDDIPALDALSSLFRQQQKWAEAADALIRRAKLEKDTRVLKEIFLQLGRIYQDYLPDTQRALVCLGKVIAVDSDHKEALDRLVKLYLKEGHFDHALKAVGRLYQVDDDPEHRIEQLLRTASIHEQGFRDVDKAAHALRQALELKPTHLGALGALCEFFGRQGDHRSAMVYLDRAILTMRSRLRTDALDGMVYHALFRMFVWRKSLDAAFCVAQSSDAIGIIESEEQDFLETYAAAVGVHTQNIADPQYDEWLFEGSIPGGFRQIFRLLDEPLNKLRKPDIKRYGANRADRLSDANHPVRRIGDALAHDMGLKQVEVYVIRHDAKLLKVENSVPPAIVIGNGLIEGVTDDEIRFFLGRSLWILSKSMVLPTQLEAEELEIVVSAIVRQYQEEYAPSQCDPQRLREYTKIIGKAIPRRIRQELMPYALECSGAQVPLNALGAAVIHSANRAGLMACHSAHAAMLALTRLVGLGEQLKHAAHRQEVLRGNPQVDELLRFIVSDEHFSLRHALNIAIK